MGAAKRINRADENANRLAQVRGLKTSPKQWTFVIIKTLADLKGLSKTRIRVNGFLQILPGPLTKLPECGEMWRFIGEGGRLGGAGEIGFFSSSPCRRGCATRNSLGCAARTFTSGAEPTFAVSAKAAKRAALR